MDETRAIARLPHSEIEIRHRRLPEEQAEQLAINLSATPLFEAFAQFLERQAPWPWLALQPWLAVAQMVQVTSQPWFAASSARAPGRRVTADRRPRVRALGRLQARRNRVRSHTRLTMPLIPKHRSGSFGIRGRPQGAGPTGKLLVSPAHELPVVRPRCNSTDGSSRPVFQCSRS
jgi:hypothetical protein